MTRSDGRSAAGRGVRDDAGRLPTRRRRARRRWYHGLAMLVIATAPTSADDRLPATSGQVWRTHSIAPFTAVAGRGSQRHVVDWILQDTGYGVWHGDTVASLSADDATVRCFHQPAVQDRVADVVARFVAGASLPHRFAVRVVGVREC